MVVNSEIKTYDKIIVYRNAGIKFVRGLLVKCLLKKSNGPLFVGKKVSITHCSHISCGKNVKFEDYSEIQGLCEEGLIFHDYVTIGRSVMIRPSSYYGGDLGKGLEIGEHSSIGPHGYVGCSGKITIGKNVMIGPKCSFFAENHNFSDINDVIKNQGVKSVGIVIEDDCWIGSNVIVLDGVKIGHGSVIGAGVLVSKDVEPYSIIIDKRNKIDRKRV